MASIAITAAGLVVSAGTAAYASHQQGEATKAQDTQQARVAALSATQQQINMRQKMLANLASQNAGTLGAVGTGQGSGFGANAMRQINQQQNDLMVSQANSSAQVSLLDQAGSNAVAAGNLGGVADLAGGASKIAGIKGI